MLLALIVPSLAGEIQVVPRVPIDVVIDGLSMPMDPNGQTVTAYDLGPGKHTVETRTAFGKTTAYKEVELAADEQIRFEYRQKELWHVATTKLVFAEPAPLAVPPPPPPGPGVGLTVTDGTETVYLGVGGVGGQIVIDDGRGGQVRVDGVIVDARTPPPPGVIVVQPRQRPDVIYVPTPPPPPAVMPMAPGPFNALLASMGAASFTSDQDALLTTAAAHNLFTIAQVKALIATYGFDSSRVDGVRILRHAVIDPENAFLLADAFDFSSNAQEAQGLFR